MEAGQHSRASDILASSYVVIQALGYQIDVELVWSFRQHSENDYAPYRIGKHCVEAVQKRIAKIYAAQCRNLAV